MVDKEIKEKSKAKTDTVLVPPEGIHTPGTVAFENPPVTNLVEVPVDAEANPDLTKAALKARDDGNFVDVPAGTGVQHPSGAALSRDELDASVKAEKDAKANLAEGKEPDAPR